MAYPGHGLIAVGGVDYAGGTATLKGDVPRMLDLTASPEGVWTDYRAGAGPGDIVDHAAIGRPLPDGGFHMVVQGGSSAAPATTVAANGPAQTSNLRGEANTLIVYAAAAVWCRTIAPPVAPFAQRHSAVYNPTDDSMIVFGGRTQAENDGPDNATWRLPLADAEPEWRRFAGPVSAAKRYDHSAVFDSAAQRMIVFGGTADGVAGMNDVHVLDLADGWERAAWHTLPTSGTLPAARFGHSAVYDPVLDMMVVHGGLAAASGNWLASLASSLRPGQARPAAATPLDDTWGLNLKTNPPTWYQLASGGGARVRGGGDYIRVGPQGMPGVLSQQPTQQTIDVGGLSVFYGGYVPEDGGRGTRSDTWALACGPKVEVAPTPPVGVTPGTTPAVPLPDLVVASAELRWQGYTGGCVTALPPLETVACVKNIGQAEAAPFDVASNAAPKWHAEGLGAGQTLCLDPQPGAPDRVIVDSGGDVREADETNNALALVRPAEPVLCGRGTGAVVLPWLAREMEVGR